MVSQPRTRVRRIEIYSSDIDTIFQVDYRGGGTEIFVVRSDRIYANETVNGRQFGRLIQDNTDARGNSQ